MIYFETSLMFDFIESHSHVCWVHFIQNKTPEYLLIFFLFFHFSLSFPYESVVFSYCLFILEIRVNVFKFLDFDHQVKKWFETKMTIITRIHISAKNGIRKAIGYIEIWRTFEWCILCTAQCPFHNIHSTISIPIVHMFEFLCLDSSRSWFFVSIPFSQFIWYWNWYYQ